MIKKEVIIFGYGPSALVTALSLAKNCITVALVNPGIFKTAAPNSPARLLSMSLSSISLFEQYDLLPEIKKIGQSINKIHVSQYNKDTLLEFDPMIIQKDNFGYMIDEHDLWRSLYSKLENEKNIHPLNGSLESISYSDEYILLKLTTGHIIKAQLLIAADGKNSSLRKYLNLDTEIKSYDQIALICNINHSKNHLGIARELFMPNGPFAILPRNESKSSSIVWTENKESEEFMRSLKPELLQEMIAERCNNMLGTVKVSSNPIIYDLEMIYCKEPVAPKITIVADSWHSIHPLAGQGLNLGLRDVKALTDLIITEKSLGLDLGNDSLLNKYQKSRLSDITILIESMSIINNLYKSKYKLIRELGHLNIKLANSSHIFKKLFAIYATGRHV